MAVSQRGRALRLRRLSRSISIVLAAERSYFRAVVSNTLESQPDFLLVGQADNGRQAVDLVRLHQPVVLVFEPRPPQLDAARLLLESRSASPLTRTIVLTESDGSQEAAAIRTSGVAEVLWKGAVLSELVLLVRKVSKKVGAPAVRAAPNSPVAGEGAAIPWGTQLSRREQEIVTLVLTGWKNREIADKLFISEQTVKNHVHNILDKLDIRDRLELILRTGEMARPTASRKREA
jgi:DNA-binding NarL/FixJ family response regulator